MQPVVDLVSQLDRDKDAEGIAQFGLVQMRVIAADVSTLFKDANPPGAGRGRQVHPPAQLLLGQAGITLDLALDGAVDGIEAVGAHGEFRKVLRNY